MTGGRAGAPPEHAGRNSGRLSLLFGLLPFLLNAGVNLVVRAVFGDPETVTVDAAAGAVVVAGVQLLLVAASVSLAVVFGYRALRLAREAEVAGRPPDGRVMARFGIAFGIANGVFLLLSFLNTVYAG